MRLGGADWSPWQFTTLELERLVVRQNAHPEPAVLDFPRSRCSLQWRALLLARIVGDCELEQPRLHIVSGQFLAEWRDDVAIEDRGWQDAIEEIYPLLINEFRIDDGLRRLRRRRSASIRSCSSRSPRPSRTSATSPRPKRPTPRPSRPPPWFSGRGRRGSSGRADFLAKPHAATIGDFEFQRVPLDRLQPIIESYQVTVSSGTLSAQRRPRVHAHDQARQGRGGGDRRRAHRLRERPRAHRARGRGGDRRQAQARHHRRGRSA